ncbi:MAG: TfoX/Sxy family protein [Pseudomonadota bacterium]
MPGTSDGGPADAPVGTLRNLGPAMERMLDEVGIAGARDLRAVGAVDAFRRLRFRFGGQVSTVALYALEGALTDRDWRSFDQEERVRLRVRAAAP